MAKKRTRNLLVNLDIVAIMRNWSDELGKPVTAEEVYKFLRESGFVQQSETDWWLVSEEELGVLSTDEVLEVKPLSDGKPSAN